MRLPDKAMLQLGSEAEMVSPKPKYLQQIQVGNVVVRTGTDEDSEGIYEVFNKHLNWINSWFAAEQVVQRFTTPERINSLVSQAPTIVAELNDVVVGFITSQVREPDTLSIANFFVDDAHRDRGVGLQMLNLLETATAGYGCSAIFGTGSTSYFPNKPSPRTLFARAGYDIMRLTPQSELYVKRDIKIQGRTAIDAK